MISLKVAEVKSFMAKLLTNNTFDKFLLREMELQTFTGFSITGQVNESFFSKDELEERGDVKYIYWAEIRQIAFSMIKGNKTPLSLKLVFQLAKEQCEELIQGLGDKFKREDLGGLFLNVRFEKGELRLITGTAIKTFTLDKSLEHEWDQRVIAFLKGQGIVFEEE